MSHMKTLLLLLSLLFAATAPSQVLYVSGPVGAQWTGVINNCGTFSQHYSSIPIGGAAVGCPSLTGVSQGGLLQVAGGAGFLWPAGTEGLIWLAVSTYWPVPPTCSAPFVIGSTLPGSYANCDAVLLPNAATLLIPQFGTPIQLAPGVTMQLYWSNIVIPVNPSLIGTWVSSQTLHLHPTSGLFQLSNRHDTKVLL